MTNRINIDPRNNPDIINFTRFLLIILLLFLIPTLLLYFNIIPLPFIKVSGQNIQAFQFLQLFIVFPMILGIIYFFFIRKNLLTWSELGFNKGKQGLPITFTYGVIGGIIDGAIVYYLISPVRGEGNIFGDFFTLCITAPIWEEFLFRVLLFTILELLMIIFINKYIKKSILNKMIKVIWYISIILILSFLFSIMHGAISIWIYTFSMIAIIVYYKTRSIIAPSIAHFISNFVAGGFFYYILHF